MIAELVTELARRFRSGGDAFALFHPQIRIEQPASLPHGGWHHGHDGVVRMGQLFAAQRSRTIADPRIFGDATVSSRKFASSRKTPRCYSARCTAGDQRGVRVRGRRRYPRPRPGRGEVNVLGSGCSLGHPVAMTGTRMVLTLSHELRVAGAGSASRRCARAAAWPAP
jgi:acetyl-CoA acetyltransferase